MIPRVVSPGQLVIALALGASVTPLWAQDSTRHNTARAIHAAGPRAIPVASLAGQPVTVLPITMLIADSSLKHDTAYASYHDRAAALARADSAIGAALAERAPEVQWVLPDELRRIARRAPGMVKDPDTYGQAMLRSAKLKELPEPLRGNVRNLVAVAGGRFTLVPAALLFSRGSEGAVHADLTCVVADARAGKVLWRAVVSGTGATADAALEAALTGALPLDSTP